MDAGDADVEDVGKALDVERVLALASLCARAKRRRERRVARADEATTNGDPGWTRETLT
jgi:hypothetical protein